MSLVLSDTPWASLKCHGRAGKHIHARHTHHAGTGAQWWNLEAIQPFCSAYGSSWGFACTKIWYQWQLETYSWSKRLGSSMIKIHFSTEMTRREGTSTSNSLCARGNLSTNKGWTQTYKLNTKMLCSRDPTDYFSILECCFAYLFIADRSVLTRFSRKLISD